MASFTLTVGQTTASRNANNTKAAQIIQLFIASQSGPVAGTDQEKADFVLEELVKYIRDNARRQSIKEKVALASGTANTEAEEVDWL